jgi:hypothetical protein
MAVVRRARARQRRLAVVLGLLWLLGHQVLPDLHLATHAWLAPHQHEGDAPRRVLTVTFAGGARASATPAAHRHGAVEHRHAMRPPAAARSAVPAPVQSSLAPRPAPRPTIDEPGERSAAPDLGHGARSLAHRTLAIAAPPPAVVAPVPTSWHLWYERVDVSAGASWRPAVAAAARGPPGPRAS